jgi:hypothetical protein
MVAIATIIKLAFAMCLVRIRPRHRVSRAFSWVSSVLQINAEGVPLLGHDPFIPDPCQIIIQSSSQHSAHIFVTQVTTYVFLLRSPRDLYNTKNPLRYKSAQTHTCDSVSVIRADVHLSERNILLLVGFINNKYYDMLTQC